MYRVLALLYDGLLLLAIWILTIVLLTTLFSRVVTPWLSQSICFFETFAFFSYFWLHRGQTLGMMAWRLRIESREPMTLMTCLKRFFGGLFGVVLLGLGYFWIWIDREGRSWGDIWSKTTTIRYAVE